MQETMDVDEFNRRFGKSKKATGKKGRYGKNHVRGEMNKTEAAFADYLQVLKLQGLVENYYFESHTLKYAEDGRFTPDFEIAWSDGRIEFVDVKGDYRHNEASDVRIKACAEHYPHYYFSQRKLLKNGSWKITLIGWWPEDQRKV